MRVYLLYLCALFALCIESCPERKISEVSLEPPRSEICDIFDIRVGVRLGSQDRENSQ